MEKDESESHGKRVTGAVTLNPAPKPWCTTGTNPAGIPVPGSLNLEIVHRRCCLALISRIRPGVAVALEDKFWTLEAPPTLGKWDAARAPKGRQDQLNPDPSLEATARMCPRTSSMP